MTISSPHCLLLIAKRCADYKVGIKSPLSLESLAKKQHQQQKNTLSTQDLGEALSLNNLLTYFYEVIKSKSTLHIHIYMYVVYICIYICVYIYLNILYIYINIYIYIYIYICIYIVNKNILIFHKYFFCFQNLLQCVEASFIEQKPDNQLAM